MSSKDFANDRNGDCSRDEYRAASVMVYDYYPFGQLMPGRSLDTAGLCVTYNNYMEIPSYRYNDGGTLGTGGGGGATPYGADTLTNLGSKGVSAHGLGGGLVYTITGITDQSIQINTYFHYLSGTDTITAWLGTNTSSTGTQLGSTRTSYISPTSALPISVGGTVASPATITLVYKMANGSSRTLFSIDSVNYTTLTYTLVTSTFSRCGDPKDKYEFGFNGQMKSNEVAGVGNHIDFKFRGYNPRLGRFWSVDPLKGQYPWNSTYAFAENRPIDGIDLEGKEWRSTKEGNVTALTCKVIIYNASNITDRTLAKVMADLPKAFEKAFSKEIDCEKYVARLVFEAPTMENLAKSPDHIIIRMEDKHVNIQPVGYMQAPKTVVAGSTDMNPDHNYSQNNRIKIITTINGNTLSADEIIRNILHELGHSGGVDHPWKENSPKDAKQDKNGNNTPTQAKTVKENLMNSAENPDENVKDENGKETTPGQVEKIDQTVQSQQPQK